MRVSVLALIIRHAMRMRRIVFSPVAFRAMPYFFTLSHELHDLVKPPLNIKCVFRLSVQIFTAAFLIQRRIQRVIITNARKVPVNLVRV